MSSSIRLLVGLANPGIDYAKTRHNAGAWFVEHLVAQLGKSLRMERKYHGQYTQAIVDSYPCHLLVPATYMNHSGQAVQACAAYHRIPSTSILIAHDDIDLDPGTVKLKFDGGDGGHNGLKDVISHLNTKQFYRLRIGVGHPGQSKDVVNFVLNPPSQAERKEIDAAILRAYEILPFILSGDIQQAMQRLHTREK